MRKGLVLLFVAALLALPAAAQRVRIVSEFQRIAPDGSVVAADRVDSRREINSPAVPRNAHSLFRVIINLPKGTPYWIFIAQNPENTAAAKMYRERPPDAVEELTQPVHTTMGESGFETYLLDVFLPADAPVETFRLEVQLNVDQDWTIYPLEIRVRQPRVPRIEKLNGPLPEAGARSDAALTVPLKAYLCGTEFKAAPASNGPTTLRSLIQRSGWQDVALARELEPSATRPAVVANILKAGGWPDVKAFCEHPQPLSPNGSEWFLKVRDYLYQGRPVR